jgi:hypothetical protein
MAIAAAVALCSVAVAAAARDGNGNGSGAQGVTFTTVAITELPIEGLTGDNGSMLYTTGRATSPTRCPVWQINMTARRRWRRS